MKGGDSCEGWLKWKYQDNCQNKEQLGHKIYNYEYPIEAGKIQYHIQELSFSRLLACKKKSTIITDTRKAGW